MILYTLGHSAHPIAHLIQLLEMHSVRLVVDVRSTPYSRFHPQYNRARLEQSLAERNIGYEWLGENLGGRPADPTCYPPKQATERDAGGHRRPDFSLVMEKAWFQEGIQRLLALAQEHKTAILCSEAAPGDCHREVLIAAYLHDRYPQVEVRHILKDGSLLPGGKTVTEEIPVEPGAGEVLAIERHSIQRTLELCPRGAILIAGDRVDRYRGLIAGLGRETAPFILIQTYTTEAYEAYAGVVIPPDQETAAPPDWAGVLNRAWNALIPGGGLYLAVELDDPPDTSRLQSLLRRAGFHIIDETQGEGCAHFIARKPRLGTNLLDYGIDEKAAGQSP